MNYNEAELCKDCKMPVKKSGAQVANTIKRQIGMSTLMEIGAHRFQIMRGLADKRGGLTFSIKYKSNRRGGVVVLLTPLDLYGVMIQDWKGRTIMSMDNVYGDQLSRVIRSGFKKLRGER